MQFAKKQQTFKMKGKHNIFGPNQHMGKVLKGSNENEVLVAG